MYQVIRKIGFPMWLFYIDYVFIELPENMLYHEIHNYQDIKLPILG